MGHEPPISILQAPHIKIQVVFQFSRYARKNFLSTRLAFMREQLNILVGLILNYVVALQLPALVGAELAFLLAS